MKFTKRTLSTLLLLILLLSLTLVLSAPALGQEPNAGNETPPTSAAFQAPESGEEFDVSTGAPPPIDCTDPLPGQVVKLVEDNEILVALTTSAGYDDSGRIQLLKLDNMSNDSTDLVYNWDWRNSNNYRDDVIWPVITTADIDGDGKDEVISALKDAAGYLQVVSLKNPEVNDGSQLAGDSWRSGTHDRAGQETRYFDIAAGDLDGRLDGYDTADEVVVAFRDEAFDLQVVMLDGESDGGISGITHWTSSDNGRGYTGDISVDIGDLDGDGYDDEIVVALADSNQNQQVVVLEYTHDGIKEIGYEVWTSNYRGTLDLNYAAGIDVTVGDFNGDFTDEIAVAVRDGSKALQITQIVFVPDADTLRGRVNATGLMRTTSHRRNDVDFISTASGDIDDDGYDEIIVAFADNSSNLSTLMLDAESGSPTLHGSWRSDYGDMTEVHWVSVDAGDIDGDGKAEVVIAFSDRGWDLRVRSNDDNPKCPCDDDIVSGLLPRDDWQDHNDGRGDLGMVWVALGDVDGDSIYGDYTGECEETAEMRLISMVNRPPYWEELNPETEVGYGTSIKQDSTTEDHITNSYGGSVTIDESFELGGVKLGPSFSYDWENSVTQSWTTGSGILTKNGWKAPEDGLVALNSVSYYAYQYKKRNGSGLARVSVPVSAQTDAKLMSIWNQSDGARTIYPDSWVPAYGTGWRDVHSISETLGNRSQGAGSDYYDINRNGKQDYLFAWIENPDEENHISYRIGWDVVEGDGSPSAGWSDTYDVDLPIGWLNSGLGVALTDLNDNGTPELVVAWIADPQGDNWAAYSVGWDLDAGGKASSWSAKKVISGWVGASTQGVGLDIFDLSGSGRPEMFFGWIDNPDGVNQGYYRVGWNLDENGDSNNWWTDHKKIEGAFGPQDSGLGLTVNDMDGSSGYNLVAAWVRNPTGNNDWAYSVGEDLDGNADVASWTPGHIPASAWVGGRTDGAALASADLGYGDDLPELLFAWVDNPDGANNAWLRIAKQWSLGGEVDQRPTDIDDSDPNDGQFKIKLEDTWWYTNGKVTWRYDEVKDSEGNSLPEIFVSKGGGEPYWLVDRTQFSEYSTETSSSYNYEIGGKAEFLGVGVEGSETWGFEEGSSYTISWENGLLLDGQNNGLPWIDESDNKQYKYVPFTYMQEAMSTTGVEQAYMVLDYIVDYPVPLAERTSTMSKELASGMGNTTTEFAGVTPGAPVIESPSHPDPNTWYTADTALFTWTQPAGDPAVVDGYRYYLDHEPDTIPSGMSFGLTDSTTFDGLPDGLWYLHLRARGDGGDWSETAHRAIRMDAEPPQLTITPDLSLPLDNGGWYNTPLTVAIDADDGIGSGVQSVEVSSDGFPWQPYTTPLLFNTDMPQSTLWARATDLVGQVSEPVSITFGLDLTAPTSVVGPGCWESGGACVAEVLVDEMGNEQLQLAGELDDGLSGVKGLSIRFGEENSISADEVGDGKWSYRPTTELGAGCHDFNIWAEDIAGNVEAVHSFATGVVWLPREKPDLSGSSFTAAPDEVRAGEKVDFELVLRNGGLQETWVPLTVDVPLGLEVLPDTTGGGEYDPDARTISWPAEYLWPGGTRTLTFSAQVDAGHAAATLDVSLNGLGTWPIAENCPAEALPGFSDLETELEMVATVKVDPNLPAHADVLPPDPPRLNIEDGVSTQSRDVQLLIEAGTDADVAWMYLREWAWGAGEKAWIVTQESGWLPYSPSYPWILSEGDGVKYLGVWLADAARNVSTLDSRNLTFINLTGSKEFLADTERIQYRFPLFYQKLAIFNAVSHEGNADLYVWQPSSGFRRHYAATGTGFVDTVGFESTRDGLYLVEVKAEGDSTYQLLLAGDVAPQQASLSGTSTEGPEHPLTVSDPLSAGAVVAPEPPGFLKTYFPVLMLPSS